MSKLLVYLTALFFLLYGAIFAVFPVDMDRLKPQFYLSNY
ncbi:hypothetical protein ACOMICROBIO_NCLOACGD_01550 [Vibrio sp. B1ASS3]|nr:hypothetical protein ACOMICROBIO_NCLOACGD_01526 [Vibrio sp. B1ASS3]CAD7806302.1 hypothetical protein ACOMICROBIO_NCLOACGD_01550 [Vibrio sp. B1ASS3]CAE6901307.1 hypothetical protein ACOMICROBIO_NCLOACGD_01526 [Vibrio sp. B1ASS3]CAE6901686.1 hypothetical protein ACOMICROBIO_NCLOACGD_01550 [Vibrio sp. B1ASS3]